MKHKKKTISNNRLILDQSSTMKNLGFFLAAIGFFCSITLAFSFKEENIKEENFPIFMIVLLLLIWVFIILPYKVISTKKKLIIKDDKFIIKSNKKKCSINASLKNMVWWREVSAMAGGEMDIGDKIQIKFTNRKIMISQLEFKSYYKLKEFFKTNFKEKEKKASR
jgi:hypothetical protein